MKRDTLPSYVVLQREELRWKIDERVKRRTRDGRSYNSTFPDWKKPLEPVLVEEAARVERTRDNLCISPTLHPTNRLPRVKELTRLRTQFQQLEDVQEEQHLVSKVATRKEIPAVDSKRVGS